MTKFSMFWRVERRDLFPAELRTGSEKKIRDESLLRRVKEIIEQVEATTLLHNIPNLTKLSGSSDFYRIRVGDYRIGILVEENEVEFVRFLHRRNIYRHFP